jgi:hypothetical protein
MIIILCIISQQCPPTPSESKKTFQGIFPANFLTENSEETTGPKGRRGTTGFPQVPGFPAIISNIYILVYSEGITLFNTHRLSAPHMVIIVAPPL